MIRLPNELIDQELFIEQMIFKDNTILNYVHARIYKSFLIVTMYLHESIGDIECCDWYNLDEIKKLNNVQLANIDSMRGV